MDGRFVGYTGLYVECTMFMLCENIDTALYSPMLAYIGNDSSGPCIRGDYSNPHYLSSFKYSDSTNNHGQIHSEYMESNQYYVIYIGLHSNCICIKQLFLALAYQAMEGSDTFSSDMTCQSNTENNSPYMHSSMPSNTSV